MILPQFFLLKTGQFKVLTICYISDLIIGLAIKQLKGRCFMEFCFITSQPEVCRLIMSRISDETHRCYIQNDWIEFEKDIKRQDKKLDLILCDFQLIGVCGMNLFEVIRQTGNTIPLIFYNDPIPKDETRVEHWMGQNSAYYYEPFPQYMKAELEKINDIITDPSIRKYIALLQPPVPVGFEQYKKPTEKREIDLAAFRRRNQVSPVIFKLFKYMYENRKNEFTMQELSRVIFNKHDFFLKRKSSVYSYISRLRKYLENDILIEAEIVRTAPGAYELVIY